MSSQVGPALKSFEPSAVDEPQIIWADDTLIVVNKPHGLATQGTKTHEVGLYESLKAKYPYVGLHHRLDQPASGLVLFTISQRANPAIAAAFQTKQITRLYRAVFAGRVTDGLWTTPIQGKTAQTAIQVKGYGSGMSACHVQLTTGRKHQIRIHAASHDHPIVGDRRYGQQWGRAWPRLALQAYRLIFIHPMTHKTIEISQPVCPSIHELWCTAGGPDYSSS